MGLKETQGDLREPQEQASSKREMTGKFTMIWPGPSPLGGPMGPFGPGPMGAHSVCRLASEGRQGRRRNSARPGGLKGPGRSGDKKADPG